MSNRMIVTGLGGTLAGHSPKARGIDWANRAIRRTTTQSKTAILRPPSRMRLAFPTAPQGGRSFTLPPRALRRLLAGIRGAHATFTAGRLAQIAVIASILRWI
jgi:hypothetical protein